MTDAAERRDERTDEATAERAAAMLTELISRMGFEATVKAVEQAGQPMLEIQSADASRLIGREGQTLDALQLLLRRMVTAGAIAAATMTV